MAEENNNTGQIQTPSALTALTDILQLFGVLISGDVNVTNDGQVKKSTNTAASTGAKKSKGIFGYLNAIDKKNQVIINKLNWDPKIFNEIHDSLKKDGPIVKSLSETIPKKIDDITKRLDLIVAAVAPTTAEPGEGENAEKSTSTATKGSSSSGDILDVLKTIGDFKYNGHKDFEQLAADTKEGGVIWEVFNNINELNNMNVDADKFKQTMDKINETKSTATAVGTEKSTKQLNTASDENEKYLIYLFGILTIGGMLILVGYLHKQLDINAIMQFSAVLMEFLVMTATVFIVASVLLAKNSATMNGLEAFGNLIAVAGGLLLAGGLLMEIIKVPLLITFAAVLYLFVCGVMQPFVWANQQLDGDYSNITKLTDAIIELVITSSIVMLLGSFIIEYIDLGNLFKFTLVLGAFIFGMLLIFKMTNAMLKKGMPAYDGMKDALKLVIGSAFIMFLGAAIMPLVNWGNVLKFILCLGTFLIGLVLIFRLLHFFSTVGGGSGEVKQPVGMKDALWLVLGSAFIMFLGAEIIKHVNVGYLFLFTITLGAFLAAVLLPYMILKSVMHTLAPTIKATVLLVVVSAAVMFIGGALLHEYPWLIGYVTLFGVMLLGFIGGLMFIYKLAATEVKEALNTAKSLALLTAVSAGILLIGGYLLLKNPGLGTAVTEFGVIMLAYMGIMALIVGLLTLFNKSADEAIKTMWKLVAMAAAISGVFMILGGVYILINKHGGIDEFQHYMIIVGVSLSAFAVFLWGVGQILGNAVSATMVGTAIACILGAAAAIWLVADAILRISDAIDRMSHISSFDPEPIFTAIYTITDIIWNLLPLTVFVLPLLAVETTILTLTFLIERIANAVKNVAELTIPIYVGTKVVGYRKLQTSDFGLAATNISLLVTTLTTGIMQAYEQHPEWYDSAGSPWLLLGGAPGAILYAGLKMMGNSPLEKVIKQSQGLAPVISKISDVVKDYADLKIREYDAKGNPVGYRRLTRKDFDSAAKNVSLLVTTLTLGIMQAYEEHPEWYGVADLSSLFESIANWGKTPLERVIAQSKALGSLISKIASGVGNMAKLKVETDWDKKTGDPIEFRQLNDSDFKMASVNVGKVVTVLTESLMSVYEDHSDWYKNGGWFGLGDNPLEKVINTNKELGKLISEIANSVQDYANLKIPLKYDKDGKPIDFRSMTDADFISAATNVNKVVSTLGSAIMSVYEAHNDWFEGSWAGLGDSPFENVIEVNKELASLVSSVANSIKNFADLKIAVGYNEKGEATSWRRMEENDFTTAARCISTVVTTLATGLNDGYTNMNLGDEDTYERFDRVLDVSTKIAGIVSTMANHISKLSKMQIPDDWNKETGEPTHYKEMNTDDFIKAANCITTVITTFATGIFYAFDPNRKDGLNGADGNIISKFMGIKIEGDEIKTTPWEETAAYSVLTASENISKVISSIANTVSNFASSKFPTAFDKNGNPTAYVPLKDAELDTATTNIMKVVKAAAHALHELLEDKEAKEFFEISPEIPENPSLKESITGGIKNIFKKTNPSKLELVLGASSQIASVIKMIAEALVMYAGGTVAADGKPIIINDTVIGTAQTTITKIIPAMGDAIKNTAPKVDDIVKNKRLQPIIDAIISMTSIVSATATSIQNIAGLRIPTKWDPETGEPIDWIPMKKTQFDDASEHIKTIVTTMAGALQEIFDDNKYPWLKEIDDSLVSMIFGHPFSGKSTKSSLSVLIILKSVFTLAQAIDVISRCIVGYATMQFPTGELNDKGHPVLSQPLTYPQIDEAKANIVKVVTSMCDAMNQITNNEIVKKIKEKTIEAVTEKISKITDGINSMISTVRNVYDEVLGIDSTTNEKGETVQGQVNSNGTSTVIDNLLKYFPTDGQGGLTNQISNFLEGIIKFTSVINGKIFVDALSDNAGSFIDNSQNLSDGMTKISTGITSIYTSMTTLDQAKDHDYTALDRFSTAWQNFVTANNVQSSTLKSNIEQMNKFATVTNNLKLNNLNSMNTFITSLNELANKMGNLDGLTDAIANKLSKALEELVARLEEAEEAITQADNIHEERRKLIKESVEKISELMKQPMTVEIQQVATQTTDESTNNTTTTT